MQNYSEPIALSRRAIFKQDGGTNIRFEIRRASAFQFRVFENGVEKSIFWRSFTPEQAKSGSVPFLSLDEAWQICVSKRFPTGYEVTAMEDGYPAVDAA
jgi:hypothetical protein